MKPVDMSSEAVIRRLRQASDLRDLCVALMNAKKAADEKKTHEKETPAQLDAASRVQKPAR